MREQRKTGGNRGKQGETGDNRESYDGGVANGREYFGDIVQDLLRVVYANSGTPVPLICSAPQHYVVDVGDQVAGAEKPDVFDPRRSEGMKV